MGQKDNGTPGILPRHQLCENNNLSLVHKLRQPHRLVLLPPHRTTMIQEKDGQRWQSRHLSIRMMAKKISSLVVVVWLYITDQLKGLGFHFNEKQVKNKFHYLQNKFKKMVDANNTAGNGNSLRI